MKIVQIALTVLSIILVLPGIVFTLQGANILPGSFMTGDPFWLVVGIIMVVAGGVLFYVSTRIKPRAE